MKPGRIDIRPRSALNPETAGLVVAGILVTQMVVLLVMGHPLICACGDVDLWHAAAAGPETSQHLTDWYSFTHVIHGFIFYFLLRLAMPNAPFTRFLVVAFGLEAGWEMIENTPAVIERYRQTALAAGYFGDSVVNSVGDTLAMASGLLVARRAPVWVTLGLLVGFEVFLAFMIRDNLTLNIIQLIHPVQAIGEWQAGG